MFVTRLMASQFRKPSGILGRLLGRLMDRSNHRLNHMALGMLEVTPTDRVLEIGFGNGKVLANIAQQASAGVAVGLDISEAMVEQATGRFRRLIRQGRMEIRQGSIDAMPLPDASVDRLFTVNTIYFWPDPTQALAEIYRVLKPGGRAVIAFRSRHAVAHLPWTRHGFTLYEAEEVKPLLEAAGFANVSVDTLPDGDMDAVIVVGLR